MTNIDLSEQQLEQIALMQKYYIQFKKLIDFKVFEPEFTGQVVLDILHGQVKNQKRAFGDGGISIIESLHY